MLENGPIQSSEFKSINADTFKNRKIIVANKKIFKFAIKTFKLGHKPAAQNKCLETHLTLSSQQLEDNLILVGC